MLAFISQHLKFIISIAIFLVILGFFPTITQLPFGLDNILITFVSTIHAVLDVVEWFRVPWYLFIAYLTIESALFLWKWISYLIEFYKSS